MSEHNLPRPVGAGRVDSRTVVHLLCNDARHPTRLLKEARSTLTAGYCTDVEVLALDGPGLSGREMLAPHVSVCRIRPRSRGLPRMPVFQALKYIEWSRRIETAAACMRPVLVHAHGLSTLEAATRLGRRLDVPVLYDAHELETDQGQPRWRTSVDRWLERRLIGYCSAVLCVSASIADWYARTYGIARPAVVRNIPDARWQAELAGSQVLRGRFGLTDADLLFIYQGGLFPGRRIGQLLRVFERVQPDRHIVFMGYGELEPEIRAAAEVRPNVHFLPAVPPAEVLRYTASADVGLTGVENVCLSYYYSLPNKLFEYLAAELPFLVPAYPEMQKLVECHACGWVVGETDDEWVALLDGLTRGQIAIAKEAARRTSLQYSWANEETVLLDTYRHLLRAE